MTESRLVYSTQTGRICPHCRQPAKACKCKPRQPESVRGDGDGTLCIRREAKGRNGKTVTIIDGFNPHHDLKQIVSRLKHRCGTGGTVKDGIIIIQGDHRSQIQAAFEAQGFKTKLAGG